MNKQERQKLIAELYAKGFGRPTILDNVEGATEWEVRQTIKKLKKGQLQVSDEVKEEAKKNGRRTALEIIGDLRPLNVVVPKVKKPSPRSHKLTTMVCVGDTHGQFVDQKAFDVACQIIQDINPDILVHLGDLGDFYSVSRYDKNPNRKLVLQEDLEHAGKILGLLEQTVSSNTRKILIEGNHEARLKKYIVHNAPALADLPQLQLPSLLGVESLGWEYVDHDIRMTDNFLVKHGEVVRSQSGYSAKAEMERTWMSGVSGHTHRLAVHEFTSRRNYLNGDRPSIWVENGCLCRMDAEYISGNGNWQQGFSIIRFDNKGPLPELVHIVNGTAYYNNKFYKS